MRSLATSTAAACYSLVAEYLEQRACLISGRVASRCRACNERYYTQLEELQRLKHLTSRTRIDILCRSLAESSHLIELYRVIYPVGWYTHTYPFNGPFSGTTRVGRYQNGKTNLDFTEARHSEWQWHQLGHMQLCTSLQTDNHVSTSPLSFFTGRMPFLPTKALKAIVVLYIDIITHVRQV